MKKVLSFLLVAIFLFSCSKEKQPSVVGSWVETARSYERSAGVYEWGPATRWPLFLTLKKEGDYSSRQEMMGSIGSYKYHPTTRELIFTSATYTNASTTRIVSFLDKETMEMDFMDDGRLLMRLRFSRKE